MAKLYLYECNRCGWEIAAPSEGSDMLMDSIVEYFVCHDCKHVFSRHFELGTVFEGIVPCPKCKGKSKRNIKYTGEF